MKRKIITTGDGSKTIQIEDWNEQYHSIHGAINEANYVYIKQGLLFYLQELKYFDSCHPELDSGSHLNVNPKNLSILEMGFGTGLNTYLTLLEAQKQNLNVNYVGIEAFPISKEELNALNYAELIGNNQNELFQQLHSIPWEKTIEILNNFKLKKEQRFFENIRYKNTFDIIYFDAFGPDVQPSLWTEALFQNMYATLKPNGILVTYASKGIVKQAIRKVGFELKRLKGPPHKHHMLRAVKR